MLLAQPASGRTLRCAACNTDLDQQPPLAATNPSWGIERIWPKIYGRVNLNTYILIVFSPDSKTLLVLPEKSRILFVPPTNHSRARVSFSGVLCQRIRVLWQSAFCLWCVMTMRP